MDEKCVTLHMYKHFRKDGESKVHALGTLYSLVEYLEY